MNKFGSEHDDVKAMIKLNKNTKKEVGETKDIPWAEDEDAYMALRSLEDEKARYKTLRNKWKKP